MLDINHCCSHIVAYETFKAYRMSRRESGENEN